MASDKMKQSEVILDAAYKCVSEKGYANISLRDIAREADVALSQLHYYFGSKQELFHEVIKRMINKYLSKFERKLEHNELGKNGIENVFDFLEDMLYSNPELFKILFDLASLSLRSESFKTLLTSLFDDLSVMIEEFVKDSKIVKDELPDFSANTLSRLLLGTVIGIAFQYTLDPNKNQETLQSLEALRVILK